MRRDNYGREIVYVVMWPSGIAKIGYTAHGRHHEFLNRGARLVALAQASNYKDALNIEEIAHTEMSRHHKQAFTTREEARQYLGGRGAGYKECYRVSSLSDLKDITDLLASMLAHHANAMPVHMPDAYARTDGRTD